MKRTSASFVERLAVRSDVVMISAAMNVLQLVLYHDEFSWPRVPMLIDDPDLIALPVRALGSVATSMADFLEDSQ